MPETPPLQSITSNADVQKMKMAEPRAILLDLYIIHNIASHIVDIICACIFSFI